MKDAKQEVEKNTIAGFAKYSSYGFQMLGTIGVFGAIGWWLDKHFEVQGKLCTIFFLLFGVIGSIVKFIFDIINDQKRSK
ncbi:MAG: AtpZ/AtpI family protein [Cytophagales bacterium]|nr:AtpZ/AtpI family protein [Cytophaga sp.]